MPDHARPLRVLRVIARLNVGGPALHTVILNDGLRRRGLDTLLVYGSVGPQEASFEDLARATRPANSPCASARPADQLL